MRLQAGGELNMLRLGVIGNGSWVIFFRSCFMVFWSWVVEFVSNNYCSLLKSQSHWSRNMFTTFYIGWVKDLCSGISELLYKLSWPLAVSVYKSKWRKSNLLLNRFALRDISKIPLLLILNMSDCTYVLMYLYFTNVSHCNYTAYSCHEVNSMIL